MYNHPAVCGRHPSNGGELGYNQEFSSPVEGCSQGGVVKKNGEKSVVIWLGKPHFYEVYFSQSTTKKNDRGRPCWDVL